ncbi:MAG: glycosyltransferase [Endomicrobium sp.]|jgi:dolichol-phosphate mannosyltransferase|nr:glycosyltransferase [Endomicrobium sp.]
MSISIVIPAYLESENLKLLLPRLQTTLKALNTPFEILVIAPMTEMDDTKSICAKFERGGVKYIAREGGNNFGDAMRTGIKYAQNEYIVTMDADGSHKPEDIKSMYESIKNENFDIVIGSRYTKNGKTDNNFILRFMSYTVNVCYHLFFNLKVRDVSTSFRIYKADKLKSLVLLSKNFEIVEEIIILFKNKYKDARINEIPVHFKSRILGESKRSLVKFAFTYIFSIVKLYKLKLKAKSK